MEKENPSNDISSMAQASSGGGHSYCHPFIEGVLDSLEPGLAGECPDFTALVNRFLSGCIAQSPPGTPLRQQLRKETEAALKQVESDLDADVIMLTLQGMSTVIQLNKFQSLDDLSLYAEAHKEAFKSLFTQGINQEQADEQQRPGKGPRDKKKQNQGWLSERNRE